MFREPDSGHLLHVDCTLSMPMADRCSERQCQKKFKWHGQVQIQYLKSILVLGLRLQISVCTPDWCSIFLCRISFFFLFFFSAERFLSVSPRQYCCTWLFKSRFRNFYFFLLNFPVFYQSQPVKTSLKSNPVVGHVIFFLYI